MWFKRNTVATIWIRDFPVAPILKNSVICRSCFESLSTFAYFASLMILTILQSLGSLKSLSSFMLSASCKFWFSMRSSIWTGKMQSKSIQNQPLR